MEPNNDLASQEALKATFELIAAKSVTRALKARTGLAGAARRTSLMLMTSYGVLGYHCSVLC